LKDIGFLIAIIINILVLLAYSRNKTTNEEKSDPIASTIIRVLGIIEIILSGIIVLFFLFKTAPILIKKAWYGALNE